MKKLLLLFTLVLIVFFARAQFPIKQKIGAPNTQVGTPGALASDSGFVYTYNFSDTNQANRGYLKNIPNIYLTINDTLWKRNNAATAWAKQGGSGGSTYSAGYGLNLATTTFKTDTTVIQKLLKFGSDYGKLGDSLFQTGDWVNVKDWGANGNGIADNTAAFKAAIATGKKNILVPQGTFLFSGGGAAGSEILTLQAGQTLYGVGSNSIMKCTANNYIVRIGGSDCRITNMKFIGGGVTNYNSAIWVPTYIGNMVDHCWFEDFSGVILSTTDGGAAINLCCIEPSVIGHGNFLTNNMFRNCKVGIRSTSRADFTNITNNIFQGCTKAYYATSGNQNFSSNIIQATELTVLGTITYGIISEAGQIIANTNTIIGCVFPIYISNQIYYDGITLEGNNIYNGALFIYNSKNVKINGGNFTSIDSVHLDSSFSLSMSNVKFGPQLNQQPVPFYRYRSSETFQVVNMPKMGYFPDTAVDRRPVIWLSQNNPEDSVKFAGKLFYTYPLSIPVSTSTLDSVTVYDHLTGQLKKIPQLFNFYLQSPLYAVNDSTIGIVTPLPIANGGTGQTGRNAAINALLPSQTSNSGKVLGTNGTDASWVTSSSGITINSTSITSGTPGRVLFENASNQVSESANLFWDITNNRLGVGGTPSQKLHVIATTDFDGINVENTAVTPGIRMMSGSANTLARNYIMMTNITSFGDFQIWQSASQGTTPVDHPVFTILGAFIGLNTSVPTYNADVTGTMRSTGQTNLASAGSGVFIGNTTTPTALLHLGAGTATASTAPLKFTSGTNLTSAEAGAMEYNGTSLFFSPSTTRLRAVLTDNSIPTNGQLPIGNGVNYTNATLTAGAGVSITNGAGSITVAATSPVSLWTNVVDASNSSNTETNLHTDALTAGQLANDGDWIEGTATFVKAANSNSVTLKFKFGSTVITFPAFTETGSIVMFSFKVIRVTGTTQKIELRATKDNGTTQSLGTYYSAATETLSNSITLKFTATCVATDDLVQKQTTLVYWRVGTLFVP